MQLVFSTSGFYARTGSRSERIHGRFVFELGARNFLPIELFHPISISIFFISIIYIRYQRKNSFFFQKLTFVRNGIVNTLDSSFSMISTFVALQISLNRAESFLSFFKRTVETVLRDQNRLTSPVGVKSPDTNRRVARAMQSIFRRSKSYLRDRNQSVCGTGPATKRNESFAVSQNGF